jgi:hypothetical protein
MPRIIGVWLLSLVVVAALASVLTAQVKRTTPRIVSGNDLGFRVEGTDLSGKPVGNLVIQVNGEWIAVSHTAVTSPAQSRY